MKKYGLVVEGGGMKCAYSAGVLDRFLDDSVNFEYCVGVSAGSANTASFLAGQRYRNCRFYTMHAQDKEYLGLYSLLKTGDFFGLKYIYATLSNEDGKDALDFDKLMANPTEYEVVATNAATGKAEYFGKEAFKRDDYSAIMASCAIPVLCHPIKLGENYYYDGGVADSIPVERAIEKGCDKVVVILSKTRDYIVEPERFKHFYKKNLREYPAMIEAIDQRHIMYQKEFDRVWELEKEGKAFVFTPPNIKMSTYSNDAKIEKELYKYGIRDYVQKREKLMEFLSR